MSVSCRSRSRMATVTSDTSLPSALATLVMLSFADASRSITCEANRPTASFSMYESAARYSEPFGPVAMTEIALGRPFATESVHSKGSIAISKSGPLPVPSFSPTYSSAASSFGPSPLPTLRAAATAPTSVTRTNSRATFANVEPELFDIRVLYTVTSFNHNVLWNASIESYLLSGGIDCYYHASMLVVNVVFQCAVGCVDRRKAGKGLITSV